MRFLTLIRLSAICLTLMLAALVAPQAGAQPKVIVVGDTPQMDQFYVNFMQQVSNVALNIEYTSGTYQVLNPTKVANLNSADLIVVSRSATSNQYDNSTETLQWAQVTAPMIVFSPFIARTGANPGSANARWHMLNSNTTEGGSGTTITTIAVTAPTDRIFTGVTIDGNTTVTLFPNISNRLRALPSTSTNGEVLATRPGLPDVPVIMRWTNTTLPYHGALTPPNKPAIGSKRYYVAFFDDNNRVIPGTTTGDHADQFARLTPDGRRLIKNILGDLVLGVPAEVTQFGIE